MRERQTLREKRETGSAREKEIQRLREREKEMCVYYVQWQFFYSLQMFFMHEKSRNIEDDLSPQLWKKTDELMFSYEKGCSI